MNDFEILAKRELGNAFSIFFLLYDFGDVSYSVIYNFQNETGFILSIEKGVAD